MLAGYSREKQLKKGERNRQRQRDMERGRERQRKRKTYTGREKEREISRQTFKDLARVGGGWQVCLLSQCMQEGGHVSTWKELPPVICTAGRSCGARN